MFQHPCEGEAVLKLTNTKIPYFNAPIYLENITQVIADHASVPYQGVTQSSHNREVLHLAWSSM